MAVKQLSVFLENKKGTLSDLAKVLADAGIDLKALTLADTKDYGIARLIPDDPDRALVVLTQAGQTASVREVCAFKVPDAPGGLAKVLSVLDQSNINMEYMYAVLTAPQEKAMMVVRTDDTATTEKLLKDNGIEIVE